MKPAQNIVDAFENRESPFKINLVTSALDTISEKDIVQGTFEITRSCGSQGIGFGSATAAELRFTLDNKSQKWDKVKFNGKEFTLTMSCNMKSFTCGYYTVDQVTRHKNTIEVVALDRMCRFDKVVNWSNFNSSETITSIISKTVTACNVVNGTNLTAWINSGQTINMSKIPDRKAMTYRQLLQYALQVLCAFGIIELDGRLAIKQLNTNPVYTISDDKLYSYEVGEEPIKVSGFKYTYGNVDNPTDVFAGNNDAWTYDLSKNPLISSGQNPSTFVGACWNHWNPLPNLYPFEAQVEPIPWIMPGDMVTIKEWRGASIKSFVTSVTIGLNIGTRIACTVDNYVRQYAPGSGLSANQIRIINQIESSSSQAKEEAKLAATHFNEVLSGSIGLKHTVLDGKDYWYNGDNIYTSTVVYTFNDGGFAWTDSYTGTSTVWKYGATRDGNAILNYLTVNKLTADQITAGSITSNLLASTYKNEVTQEIKDETSHYLLKTEYESGITQTENNIKLWVKENPAYINPNLVTNGYDPLVWRDEVHQWAELVNDPTNEDPLLRHCFKTYRKQGNGNSWWPYVSNAFAFDPSKSYAVSCYVSDVTGPVGSVLLTLELYNSITGPYNLDALVRKRSFTFNVSEIPEDGVLKCVFLSSNSQAGDAQAKMAHITIGVARESGDTTSGISCKINRIKVEESDTCTPWQECNSSQSQIYSLINVTKDQILMEIRPSSSNLLTNTYEPKDPSYTHVAESHGGNNAFDVWKFANSTTKWKAYTNRFAFDPKKKYILSFRIKNWQGNASDNGISPHLMMGTASSKGIESVANIIFTIKQSTSGTGIKTWIYDPNRTGSWTNGKTYGEYYSAQNVKTAYIEFEPVTSTSESAGAYIDHIRFEEGDTPGQWTEYDKNVNDLYTMFKMTEDSIMLQAENIRLKAETLVWEANNSSLSENGTLVATNANFNNCSMTGNMTTTNGNYSTTINGGAAKFKYLNKESGSIWSDSSNRLRISSDKLYITANTLYMPHPRTGLATGKTGVIAIKCDTVPSNDAYRTAYAYFVNGILIGLSSTSVMLDTDYGALSISSISP